MSRKLERFLFRIVGFWQIGQGVFTIIYYSIINRSSLTSYLFNVLNTSQNINNTFHVINIFGTLMIGIGLFNLVVSKNYMKDNTSSSIGIWLLINGLFSYLIMDVVSLLFGMPAAIVFLAKNKSIKYRLNKNQT